MKVGKFTAIMLVASSISCGEVTRSDYQTTSKNQEKNAQPTFDGTTQEESRQLTPDDKLILAAKGYKTSMAILVGLANPLIGLLIAAYDPAESSADLAKIDDALAQGANINFQEEHSGYTALIYGAYGGYPNIVKHLVTTGADIEIKEQNGYNAYTMAKYYFNKYTKRLSELCQQPLGANETSEQRQSLTDHYRNYINRYSEIMKILNHTQDKEMPTWVWRF